MSRSFEERLSQALLQQGQAQPQAQPQQALAAAPPSAIVAPRAPLPASLPVPLEGTQAEAPPARLGASPISVVPEKPVVPMTGAARKYVFEREATDATQAAAMGRERNIVRDVHKMQIEEAQTRRNLIDAYRAEYPGLSTPEIERRVDQRIAQAKGVRLDPEAEFAVTGKGGWLDFIPTFRETRIEEIAEHDFDLGRTVYKKKYRDPDTGDLSDPTTAQLLTEAFARQVVLDANEVMQTRQQRRAEVLQAMKEIPLVLNEQGEEMYRRRIADELDPSISNVLTAVDPEAGVVVETPFGAALRALPAVSSTLINEAVMGYAPLFWEQDPETGEPVDASDPAYRAHLALRNALRNAGKSPEEVDRLVAGLSPTGMVMPFQPIQRRSPHAMDPLGRRAAGASGNFLQDVATALATGRSMGDELMSMPGMTTGDEATNKYIPNPQYNAVVSEDDDLMQSTATTLPYWLGVGAEMLYGFGPLALPKTATRVGARAAGRAAQAAKKTARASALPGAAAAAKAAEVVEKGAQVAHSPVESARRAVAIRAAQDMTGQTLDDLSILLDRNTVRRVAGEKVAEEVVAPYVMMRATLQATPPTGAEMIDLAAGSQAGLALLNQAGVSSVRRTLTRAELLEVRRRVSEWVGNSYAPKLRAIVDDDAATEAAKARRVLGVFEDAGVNPVSVPRRADLLRIAKGGNGMVADVMGDVVTGRRALQIVPTNPVLQSAHDLGAQLAGTRGGAALRGPLARGFARRLGKQLDQASNAEVLTAARGSVGRAVEATLENVVPDDMVFVTRQLMAPRKLVTKDVLADVKQTIKGYGTRLHNGPVVDGRPTSVRTFVHQAEVLRALQRELGGSRIQRSRFWERVTDTIRAGQPINDNDYTIVVDALMDDAFRRALRNEAKDAVFAGLQVDEAMIEGVNVGLGADPSGRVARKGMYRRFARDAQMVVNASSQAIGSAVRKATKRQPRLTPQTFSKQTPHEMTRLLRRMNETVGSIADVFRSEVRDTVAAVRAAGGTAEEGFNIVVARRVQSAIDDALEQLEAEVDRLVDAVGMPRENAYYVATYRRGQGGSLPGVGEAAGVGTKQVFGKDTVRLIRDRVEVAVMENAWQGLLKEFFGAPLYNNVIAPDLGRFIVRTGEQVADMSPSEYLTPSTGTFRDVVARLRKAKPDLENRGLAPGPLSGSEDAVVELLSSWALSSDRARAVTDTVRELRATVPELFIDLVPDRKSAQPSRAWVEAELPLRARAGLIDTLVEASVPRNAPNRVEQIHRRLSNAQQHPAYKQLFDVATDPTGRPRFVLSGAVKPAVGGEMLGEFDAVVNRLLRDMGPKARSTLLDATLAKMLSAGTTHLDMPELIDGLDSPMLDAVFFKKDATTQAMKAIIRGLDLRAAQNALQPADAFIYELIQKARAAGVTDGDLVGLMRKKVTEDTWGSVIQPLVNEATANARAMGFVPERMDAAQANLIATASDLDAADPSLLLFGTDFIEAVAELQKASMTGRLAENMDALKRRDLLSQATKGGSAKQKSQAAAMYAANLVANTWAAGRTMAASGLLAGGFYVGGLKLTEDDDDFVPFIIPSANTRYLGMNTLSVPIIALATVGARGAFRAMRGPGLAAQTTDVAKQLASMVGREMPDLLTPRDPKTVLFVSDTGREWTHQEFQAAVRRNNIQTTRGSVEFTDAYVRDLKRDAAILSSGQPAGKLRNFLRTFDPLRTNIPQYVANATDKVFRYNAFAKALAAGMPEEQAAALARAVVLDYGDVLPVIKQHINRYVLFASFRVAMYTETLRALARDPGTFNRLLLAQRNVQQTGDQFLFGPDYAKTRLPVDLAEYIYDGEAGAMIYGPVMPQVDALKDFTNLAAFVAHFGAEDNDWLRRSGETVAEENLAPLVSGAIRATLQPQKPGDPGFKVPDVMVAHAVENGWWPVFKDRYNVVPVTDSRRRSPGRPTAYGREWRFDNPADMRRFENDMIALTYLGAMRSMEDWTKIGLTFDADKNIDPKRRQLPSTIGFMIGAQTPITTRSPEELSSRAIHEQVQALQGARRRGQ